MSAVTAHELYGTTSSLLNALARFWYGLRSDGATRTLLEVASKLRYKGAMRWRGWRVTPPPPGELATCSWLGQMPEMTFRDRVVDDHVLADFMERAAYPRWYYARARRIRYGLWHMVGIDLCELDRKSVVIDVGAQAGIWGRVATRTRGCSVISVDLRYPPGVHGWRVGADAGAIPLPSGCATHVVSFCAFNCFEGAGDTAFLREAERLLGPGGKLLIVPLCVGDKHVNLYDPLLSKRALEGDEGAELVAYRGWGVRFNRWYDRGAFEERVLSRTEGFHKTIWRIRYDSEHEALQTTFYAAQFEKALSHNNSSIIDGVALPAHGGPASACRS